MVMRLAWGAVISCFGPGFDYLPLKIKILKRRERRELPPRTPRKPARYSGSRVAQNSKYPSAGPRRTPSVPVAGSMPATPRRFSHAASVRAGSAPTMSRIICQAATLRAPSGGGPIAKETEHWGQKQIRCADDFCRGLTPTVWANM